ncbi:hatching enzyme 1.2-like [Paramacrobiotus metropolitanus]|uniref:hatching enzyme 1.2-like n=1 Tax=Paramacrobiotus metropolitanus TaxID=2943436 RepID=UPI0024464787|nr:hatching enzyme 1.2-like [Paramacrobiotus metropolitanus]
MEFFHIFYTVLIGSSFVAAAPAKIDARPPIDPTCVNSVVVSSHPAKCFETIQENVDKSEELQNLDEPILFEGDIAGIIAPGDTIADLETKLSGLSKGGVLSHQRWPGAWMYYDISSAFTAAQRDIILSAMREFESKTDTVRFFQRTTGISDYINILKAPSADKCWSIIGKQGGAQTLYLGNNCVYFGTVVHELMHAIGFWHEQARNDRDTYVEINWNNINKEEQYNFNKYAASSMDIFDTGYDFGSIMHYPKYAFAVNPSTWTIRPKSPWQNSEIGQTRGLSATDIKEINGMYPLCATLWVDPSYTGQSQVYVRGLTSNLHASLQDKLSSAKVTLGCALTIYDRVNSQGTSTVFKPTQEGYVYWSFEGKTWDNAARSIKCTCV